MKSTVLNKGQSKKSNAASFKIKQALAAIELGQTDSSILNYMKFLSRLLPIENKAFIHVIPDMSLLTSLYAKSEGIPFSKYDLKDKMISELSEQINETFSDKQEITEMDVLEGDPLEKLLVIADEIKADMLFIGQNTERKYHSILAKNLARKAKGNAFIIPDTSRMSLEQILVPIDFSDNSKKALDTAIALNRQLEKPATITCLHVYEMPNLSRYKIAQSSARFNDMVRSNKKEALEDFMENLNPEDRAYINLQLSLKDLPNTAKYIMESVKENKADLIIMGAKGHSRVERLLMGSVTEKLLKINKSVPTLIVK